MWTVGIMLVEILRMMASYFTVCICALLLAFKAPFWRKVWLSHHCDNKYIGIKIIWIIKINICSYFFCFIQYLSLISVFECHFLLFYKLHIFNIFKQYPSFNYIWLSVCLGGYMNCTMVCFCSAWITDEMVMIHKFPFDYNLSY